MIWTELNIVDPSVKTYIMTFVRENQIIPRQGVYFFTNIYTALQNHRNIYTVVMKNMINTIGKNTHFGKRKLTNL